MLLWEGNLHNSPGLLLLPHPAFISLQSTTSFFRTNKYIFKIARALCPHPVALTRCAVNFADRSSFPRGRCNLHSQTFSVLLLDSWLPGQNCFRAWGLTARVGLGRARGDVQVQSKPNILPQISLGGASDLPWDRA